MKAKSLIFSSILSGVIFTTSFASEGTHTAIPSELNSTSNTISNAIEETTGPSGLKHPGCLQSAAEINALAVAMRANTPQRTKLWTSMMNNERGKVNSNGWQPSEHLEGHRFGNLAKMSGAGLIRYANDWILHRNPQSEKAAIQILNSWAKVASFEPNPKDKHGHHRLESQWLGYLAHGADLLISSGTSWPLEEQEAFKNTIRTVLLPIANENRAIGFNANWDLGATWAVMAMAVLLDDRELFDAQIKWLKEGKTNARISHYLLASGQNQESARDQGHAAMGLNFLSLAAQVAWTQGMDLYECNGRSLGKAFEYYAAYNLGENHLPFQVYPSAIGSNSAHDYKATISEIGRPTFFSVYEMVYHHYKKYRGVELPYCLKVLKEKTRPEEPGPNWSNHGSVLYWNLDMTSDAARRKRCTTDMDLAISPHYKGRPFMRLNAGGPHYVAKDGRAFSPRLVKGGGFMGGHKASSSEPVADTEDEALYQSYRTGMLGFRTPLTNGTYLVTLHFSEPMHTNINQRVFNVEIEEKPVFRKLDLFAVAGKNVARSKTSKVVVRDDELNITFEPLMGSPLINAIEVEPAMPTQKKKRR